MTAKGDPVGYTVVACTAGAVVAVVIGLASGFWRAGVAVALGLLVGSVNGFLARRALGADAGFRVTSLGRLTVLSAVGLILGALLGLPYVPLVLLGIAAAQLVLAVVSTVTMVRT